MIRGSCLCSAVRYEMDGELQEAHHCHCARCRKSHGAAFATFGCCREAQLKIVLGAESLKVYRSSRSVRRTFCGTCGSSLFFAHDALPELVWIAVATLDDPSARDVRPDAHTFVGSKAAWWSIDDDLPRYEKQRPEYG